MRVALDIRTTQPRFPGIGRYVQNLADQLPSHLRPEDSLTLLGAPRGKALASPTFEDSRVGYCETRSGVFSIRQRWDIPDRLATRGVELFHMPLVTVPIPLSIPQVLTLNDLIPVRLPRLVSWRARMFFPWFLRIQLRQVSQVIVPSEFTQRELIAWSDIPPEQITVIPHAVGQPFQPPNSEEISRVKQKFGLSDYLLALTSRRPHKNLARLEAAYWSSALSLPLVIAGTGWTPHQKRQGDSQVLFFGQIPEADLPGLYAGAALVIFPSLYEGFGFPVAEALSCGCAVACSGNTALPELAGPAARYFDPYSVREIRACLEDTVNHPEQLDYLRGQARLRAQSLDWEGTTRATANLYRRVLDCVPPHKMENGEPCPSN